MSTLTRHFAVHAWHLSREPITHPEARLLTTGIESGDFAVYGDGRSAARNHARNLATRGLVTYLSGAEAGWAPAMWGAVITCPGFNAVWAHHDNTHTPGCGSAWAPTGLCSGCGTARRLDLEAFNLFCATDLATDRDRNVTPLWCSEHGYLRGSQWRTDKTCQQPGRSPHHDPNTMRIV